MISRVEVAKLGVIALTTMSSANLWALTWPTKVSVTGTCTRSSSAEKPETYGASATVMLDRSYIRMKSSNADVTVEARFGRDRKFKEEAKLPPNDHRSFSIEGQLNDNLLTVHYSYSAVWGRPLQPGYPDTEGWAGMDCDFTGKTNFVLSWPNEVGCCTGCRETRRGWSVYRFGGYNESGDAIWKSVGDYDREDYCRRHYRPECKMMCEHF